jgi:serine protease Do
MRSKRWVFGIVALIAAIGLIAWIPFNFSTIAYAVQSARASIAAENVPTADGLSRTFEQVASIIRPSVVSVSIEKKVAVSQGPDPYFQMYRDFFGQDFMNQFFRGRAPDNYVERGLGSGVIVSQDGYILTNNHVVDDASRVTVRLAGGRTLTARVVGTDPKTDLAVVKVDANGLHPAKLGDSDELSVGQWVMAVGNPFGLNSSISAGIVSATGRANIGVADYENFIQTDAAINPGNSGGPLVDLHGDVVGINTAIFTRSGGYMGIGFSIPIDMARSVMNSLIEHGRVVRGWLGVVIQDLNSDLADSFHYHGTDGALVAQVNPGSPAERAGLEPGDIIVRFNGKRVTNTAGLRDLAANTQPKKRVQVEVFRAGAMRSLDLEVGEQNAPQVASAESGSARANLGLTVQTLTPDIARQLNLDTKLHGVIVTAVDPMSPADEAGIQPQDVILEVGGDRIADTAEFRQALNREDLKTGVRMLVQHGAAQHFVFVSTGNPS